MSGYGYALGQGSVILRLKLNDSSATSANNIGKTGLTGSGSAGLIISTLADNEASPTVYTQAGSTIQTIATLGTYAAPTAGSCRFKEVDSTNFPGWYEVQLANGRFSVAGSKSLAICFPAVSGITLAQQDIVIPLTDIDPYSRAAMFQAPMTEGYSVVGTPGTPEQAYFEFKSLLQNKAVVGTVLTTYKVNGVTVAMTYTLNSASTPTQILRAS